MAVTGQRPLIAITVDTEDPGGYSKFPWYALRENYAGVVAKAGGMPLILPNEAALVEDYAALIDGLVITGGVVGVLALRLSSGLFIRLLQRYRRLEAAGYLAVGLVGIQLSVRVFRPDLELPEWALLVFVGLLFAWGFSAQQAEAEEVQP